MISRADAKAAGLKRYFTGKPCLRGHVAERGVVSRQCAECNTVRKATPEYRATERARQATAEARSVERARYVNNPRYRAAKSAREETPEYRVKTALRIAKRQAQRAAKILTETLGIPHTAVKMEDGTFHVQPVPVTT